MAAKQTSILLGRLVEHQDYFHPLSTEDAQWAIRNPKDAAALCAMALKNHDNGTPKVQRAYRLLRPVAPKPVESRPFKADDTFFNKKSGVKMTEHGSNFNARFAGYMEEDPTDEELIPLALTQNANDSEIIADLGGEEKAEVKLSQIWRLMKRQANGGEGALLNNGWANIFYVRDREGVLRTVSVLWNGGGWRADAVARDGYGWGDGDNQVFSRNS